MAVFYPVWRPNTIPDLIYKTGDYLSLKNLYTATRTSGHCDVLFLTQMVQGMFHDVLGK
jgi:hypothetical protein